MKTNLILACLGLLLLQSGHAQTYETNNVSVQTFVGSGFYGHVDGQGTQTMFYNPSAIVRDSSGNFFVTDNFNYRIRKVTASGEVSTFAGGGQSALPGYGTNVSLQSYFFSGMAIDHSNNLWIVGMYNSVLRIAPDGLAQWILLPAISQTKGVCVDSKNNVYISDNSGHRIYRLLTNEVLEVFAGSGNPGAIDGNGIFTSFQGPSALAIDAADNVYVWDAYNYVIRRITQTRDVETIAGKLGSATNDDGMGTNASFAGVSGMTFDPVGNLILSSTFYAHDLSGTAIRKMSPGTQVTTIAGDFSQNGFANGTGSNARFNGASGLCFADGMIFVADFSNHRIRTVNFDSVEQPVTGANLQLDTFPGLRITGIVGRAYRVESSTDMNTWNSEKTILLTRNPFLWIDENTAATKKFYRALLLP